MRTPTSTPTFDFGELQFDHGDVVLAAIAWGEWQVLERSLAEGLACKADADRRGERVDDEELHAAVVAFRRSRRLLAGEEYLGWLAARSLDPTDVIAHFERMALRRRARARIDEVLATHPPTADQLERLIDIEAMLSGRLRSWGERLARCAAARRALQPHDGGSSSDDGEAVQRLVAAAEQTQTSGLSAQDAQARAPLLAELVAAESAFRAVVATAELIERRLGEHSLEWQRLVWSEATFHSEGAAREAALMVREDGTAIESVVTLAHADSRVREAYFAEVPELANQLLAAPPGELVGPFHADGEWRLARLRERAAVSAEDPALRERAIGELLEDALARHLAGRVSWHVES